PLILAAGLGALAACQPATLPVAEAPATGQAGATAAAARFDALSESLLMRALERSPEWSIYSGRYDNAASLTIPDAARRADDLAFARRALAALAALDAQQLPAAQRIDHLPLTTQLRSSTRSRRRVP